jgi:SAM-dependent methyltransferase
MHQTAMQNGQRFFETYVKGSTYTIADIGAQDVNGSLRDVAPQGCKYIGVDFAGGNGVDVVLDDPYSLPFDDDSLDVIVSSSCFEHSEFFWLLFVEIMRVLKPDGLFYLNVPSNGVFHRYPVDCWRFYPDSGVALANWARRHGFKTVLLESYTSNQNGGGWNDFVAVFLKDERFADKFPTRIQDGTNSFSNGLSSPGLIEFSNPNELPEDLRRRYFWRVLARFRAALGR